MSAAPVMPALPRGLILLASLWLFCSWLGSMGVHPPLHVATSSYTPSVRIMLLSSAVGAIVAWPLVRLCAARCAAPILATWLDLAVVLGMFNMVLWPLRLVTPWPVTRMALLMSIVCLWIVAIGGIVATARGSGRGWVRALAMMLVLACSLGAITARMIGVPGMPEFPSSLGGPVEAILAVTTSGGAPPTVSERGALEIAASAALLAWAVALATAAIRARGRGRDASGGLPRNGRADTLASWN